MGEPALAQKYNDNRLDGLQKMTQAAAAAGLAAAMAFAHGPALAVPQAEFKLPPLDPDPKHCEAAFTGNTIGQANAVSNKLLDLRKCDFKGADLKSKTLAGALLSDSSFVGADMKEAVLTKSYGVDSDFSGVDFTSAVLDRTAFDGSKFVGANFYNAVLTGTTFEGSDMTDAQFEGALIGQEDAKRICANPTLGAEEKANVGCRASGFKQK